MGYYGRMHHRPIETEKAERAAKVDKVMRDLIEALKPHGLGLVFPSPDKREPAVEAAVYGKGLLPGDAWPCRINPSSTCASVTVRLCTDGTDENHGKPFHMEIFRYADWRRNRNEGKFRFKGKGSLTLTPAMVENVVEALTEAEAAKAREQDDAKARNDITGVLKAEGIIPPGGSEDIYLKHKDFNLSVHEGYFTARWSVYPRTLTPHQMACILTGVATAVRFDSAMLDTFDAHSLTLKVKADQVNTFKAVATLVEGCANDFDKVNKAAK